jgi:hypothetical protein
MTSKIEGQDMREKLRELRVVCDEALESLYQRRYGIGGGVNWGDLTCVEARHIVTDSEEDDEFYEVLVEEVAPEAQAFQTALVVELERRGWMNVHVQTEW